MAEAAKGLFPNIRKLFIPDPGHIICDVDLAGADAQVVAWEANDGRLKDAFKVGLKIHKVNGADMWGERFTSLDPESYQYKALYKKIKSGVHGTNYGESAKTLAITGGIPLHEAAAFQKRWFDLHPGILEWHSRVKDSLARTRSVTNAYGFSIRYFDRIDSCFTQALAWIPQSTVAITCFKGALNVRKRLPWVRLLIQVHDSLVFQIPRSRVGGLLQVRDFLSNTIPYPDPLVIPWGLSISDRSWGDCQEVRWEDAIDLRF